MWSGADSCAGDARGENTAECAGVEGCDDGDDDGSAALGECVLVLNVLVSSGVKIKEVEVVVVFTLLKSTVVAVAAAVAEAADVGRVDNS